MRRLTSSAALAMAAAVLLAGATEAKAQNGHVRQGVGAVNSSMGGAGAATTQSLLGTMYLNPAAIVAITTARVGRMSRLLVPIRMPFRFILDGLLWCTGPLSNSAMPSNVHVSIHDLVSGIKPGVRRLSGNSPGKTGIER